MIHVDINAARVLSGSAPHHRRPSSRLLPRCRYEKVQCRDRPTPPPGLVEVLVMRQKETTVGFLAACRRWFLSRGSPVGGFLFRQRPSYAAGDWRKPGPRLGFAIRTKPYTMAADPREANGHIKTILAEGLT